MLLRVSTYIQRLQCDSNLVIEKSSPFKQLNYSMLFNKLYSSNLLLCLYQFTHYPQSSFCLITISFQFKQYSSIAFVGLNTIALLRFTNHIQLPSSGLNTIALLQVYTPSRATFLRFKHHCILSDLKTIFNYFYWFKQYCIDSI